MVGLFICAFGTLAFWSIESTSLTFDEPSYVEAGAEHLQGRFSANPEHPPLGKELMALPFVVLQRAGFLRDRKSVVALTPWFRLMNLVAGLATVALCAWWAWRLWRRPDAPVIAGGLAAFDPNLIANASVATLDGFLTLFTTLSLYLLWENKHQRRELVWAAFAGFALGCALATKAPAVILLPFVLFFFLPEPWPAAWHRAIGHQSLRLALALTVAAVTILATYGFTSAGAFVHGAVWQAGHTSRGHDAYFLGEYSSSGWLLYFPAAMFFKTPLATLVMLALGIVAVISTANRRAIAALVGFPLLFIALTMLSYVNIGVRYVLPAYPPLIVAASSFGAVRWTRGLRALPLVMVAVTAVSVGRLAPHMLAYFNEAAGGPLHGPALLSDSNIDWGQDVKNLAAYQAREGWPTIYFAPFSAVPPAEYGVSAELLPSVPTGLSSGPSLVPAGGRQVLAISVTTLQGVYLAEHSLYHWLFPRQPFGRAGYSILLYDITDDADAHERLADVRTRTGDVRGAQREHAKAAAISARFGAR